MAPGSTVDVVVVAVLVTGARDAIGAARIHAVAVYVVEVRVDVVVVAVATAGAQSVGVGVELVGVHDHVAVVVQHGIADLWRAREDLVVVVVAVKAAEVVVVAVDGVLVHPVVAFTAQRPVVVGIGVAVAVVVLAVARLDVAREVGVVGVVAVGALGHAVHVDVREDLVDGFVAVVVEAVARLGRTGVGVDVRVVAVVVGVARDPIGAAAGHEVEIEVEAFVGHRVAVVVFPVTEFFCAGVDRGVGVETVVVFGADRAIGAAGRVHVLVHIEALVDAAFAVVVDRVADLVGARVHRGV